MFDMRNEMKATSTFGGLLILLISIFFAPSAAGQRVESFPLTAVRLLDGPFKAAQDVNAQVLLAYDTDRLLAPFLKRANLTPKAESFDNWADLDGHVGGHYLSALAIHYAATGNEEFKRRMDYFVSELKRCQEANGDGYCGGAPGGREVWEQVRKGDGAAVRKLWVPWYNLHKTFAGLRDAYLIGGNPEAREVFLRFADWACAIVDGLSDTEMEKMLEVEFGGMNEVLADAYAISGDDKYLLAARRFSHRKLFDSMAKHVDNLDNMHANTQVPKAVGYARVAEVSGDKNYADAAAFFWQTVVDNRTLSFGGNSRREHFPTAAACSDYIEDREGPESCNTNNMLKLTETLFRLDPQARLADYYERAMFNHILSSHHPEHGGYVYFTPARPRHYRVYSQPNSDMWCCVGTGMENHGKYGELVYAHTDKALYVNLFVASELTWADKGVTVTQHTTFPDEERTELTMTVKKPQTFALLLRKPEWLATDELTVSVNGAVVNTERRADGYVGVERKWKSGDCVTVALPMLTRVEPMPNVPDYLSIVRGPIVLAMRAGTDHLDGLLADGSRWGHIAHGPLLPLAEAPAMIGSRQDIDEKVRHLTPVEGKPMHFTCPGLFAPEAWQDVELEPFSGVHDCRYIIYWPSMTAQDFATRAERQAKAEAAKLDLDKRTVDRVTCAEQQPEVDHDMRQTNTRTGIHHDERWRAAKPDGSFSYNLATKGETHLALRLRYTAETNDICSMDIELDGQSLAHEAHDAENDPVFIEREYNIDAAALAGKTSVTVTFRPAEGKHSARIMAVYLLKP